MQASSIRQQKPIKLKLLDTNIHKNCASRTSTVISILNKAGENRRTFLTLNYTVTIASNISNPAHNKVFHANFISQNRTPLQQKIQAYFNKSEFSIPPIEQKHLLG